MQTNHPAAQATIAAFAQLLDDRLSSGRHDANAPPDAAADPETTSEIAAPRSLKIALDPKGILNPGRMLPADDEG